MKSTRGVFQLISLMSSTTNRVSLSQLYDGLTFGQQFYGLREGADQKFSHQRVGPITARHPQNLRWLPKPIDLIDKVAVLADDDGVQFEDRERMGARRTFLESIESVERSPLSHPEPIMDQPNGWDHFGG